jgi:beta-phosphoglucomutase
MGSDLQKKTLSKLLDRLRKIADSDRRTEEPTMPAPRTAPRSPLLDRLGIRAVIFDMDGVLVETKNLHLEAYKRVLAPLGLNVKPIDIASREGLATPAVLRSLSNDLGWGLGEERIQELANRRRRIFHETYEHRVFPEIPEILRFLQSGGYQLAVVSGATQKSLDMSLQEYPCANGKGLAQWFAVIISGSAVARGKPYPDPYLAALSALRLAGREALVVENAPAGITAAKGAGCYCVAVESTLPKSYLGGADWVVPSHAALLDLLRER